MHLHRRHLIGSLALLHPASQLHARKGARIGEFNTEERVAAQRLLRAIVSSQGYYKALAITHA